jgi:hypothetical protein
MAFAIGLLALTASRPVLAADPASAEGVVEVNEDGRVTLKTATGETTVIISDDTNVTDGKTKIMKKAIRPGDVLVVKGTKGSEGNITATDVTLKSKDTDKK